MATDWFNQPLSTDGKFTSSHLSGRSVTSESLSLNALTRTNSIFVPALTSCSSLGGCSMGSTNYILFRAVTPVTVQRVTVIPTADLTNLAATSGCVITILTNGCSTMSQQFTTSTAAVTGGSRIDLGTLTNAALAACSELRWTVLLSSCGAYPAHTVQVDYTSTA